MAPLSTAFAEEHTSDDARPNIIFIFADDLGWGDISQHGHPDIRTPNIDRLANEGSEFYQFSVSNPVCSPSRTAVMTGHYPARHNVNRHFASLVHHQNMAMGDWLDKDVVTMPRLLKNAGYATGHFGKWHLGNNRYAPLPVEYGYDETTVFNGGGPQTTSVALYDDAIDFITRHKDERFFVNLWIHETHLPHYPSEESLAKYQHLPDQTRVYAAVMDQADQRIGKVLNALDDLGLTGNTLVIFSSDNGPAHTGTEKQKVHRNDKDGAGLGIIPHGLYYSTGSSGGLRGGKQDTYEGGLRVPFLVRWPGHVPAGRADTESIVTAVDLLPTFAEISGATLPSDYVSDGQSVVDLLLGGSVTREKPMFWEWRYGIDTNRPSLLAVREGPWKLFVHRDVDSVELYNVMRDRAETMNVAADYPEMVARMKALALEWKATLPEIPPANAVSPARKNKKMKTTAKKKKKKNKKKKN
ncbi:MAG: sulfatase-like hydrolase/transferase [Litorimonas sp.]